MAYPTIVFNNSTGSDTAASGAGPGTALSGSSASYSGSTVTLDGSPDLSGVATDGSHVLFLDTTSGRKFFTINAVDNGADTVTLDDAPAGTATGLTWAIGGKRATFDNADSRQLFKDAKHGWIIVTETDQTLTSALGCLGSGTGRAIVKGDSESTRRVVNNTANAPAFVLDWPGAALMWEFQNFQVTNSNGSKTYAVAIRCDNGTSTNAVMRNCVLGDATNTLAHAADHGGGVGWTITLIDCEIKNCTSVGLAASSYEQGQYYLYGCWVHDCAGAGVKMTGPGAIVNCIIEDNGDDGVQLDLSATKCVIWGNTIDGNTGDGLSTGSASGSCGQLTVANNIFSNNGGYGWTSYNSDTERYSCFIGFNTFYNNTSGARNNVTAATGDSTSDPGYTDAAGNDFSVGTNMKATGFPDSTRNIGADNSATVSFVDMGAAQREEPVGGGGGGGPLVGGRLVQ